MPDKEKRLDPTETKCRKPLVLPNVGRKGFTKAEMDLIREMEPDIEILPDGSYTINGETPAEILAKYELTIRDLTAGMKPKKMDLDFIPGKQPKVDRK